MTAAVMTDDSGWVTHANTSACRMLSGRSERGLVTLLGEANDQCMAMPHWLPNLRDGSPNTPRHCLAYSDDWNLVPTRIHLDDLIGSGTTSKHVCREALALIAVEPDGERIPDDTFEISVLPYGSILRISPEDFLVVLPGSSGAGDAAFTVHRVLDAMARSRGFTDPETGPFESAAPIPTTFQGPASLRRTGFTPLGAKLHEAVQRHALNLMYQPQFDLKTGRGCGMEALARWTLSCGIIAPSIFIPVAEHEE